MKSYLLLFLSAMFLLFTLPKGSSVSGMAMAEQGRLKKTCAPGLLKRPCARKCLKHQTHSEQSGAGTAATSCSLPVYAILDTPQAEPLFPSPDSQEVALPVLRRYLSPNLEHEPDPPRFS